MKFEEKQKLWSKYYLLNNNHDRLGQVSKFLTSEVRLYGLKTAQEKRLKKKKLLKYMLKSLDKSTILSKYCPNRHMFENYSKNKLIDFIVEHIK